MIRPQDVGLPRVRNHVNVGCQGHGVKGSGEVDGEAAHYRPRGSLARSGKVTRKGIMLTVVALALTWRGWMAVVAIVLVAVMVVLGLLRPR